MMSCSVWHSLVYFFFFQAEDGIRAGHVTGVQTCALPISVVLAELLQHRLKAVDMILVRIFIVVAEQAENGTLDAVGEIDRRDRTLGVEQLGRSEERRVGKSVGLGGRRVDEKKDNVFEETL